jgi:hypothetical protein
MAKFDQGGGCACGLNAKCECERGKWDTVFIPSQIPKFINDQITDSVTQSQNISYKYAEDRIVADFKAYLDKTYGQHYKSETAKIECFDAWIALGDSTPTFRNTALKYLWRYGKKNGNNKDDLMKTLHYVLMCMYVDHYKDDN